MSESPDTRLRRLSMRSWRRGIKEMDLILGQFADGNLSELGPQDLDIYETLLDQNDHDLYAWAANLDSCPAKFKPLLTRIMAARSDNL